MRNEMRGFFFLSYALFCFAIYYLSGGFYYGGGENFSFIHLTLSGEREGEGVGGAGLL